jgi:hypothetical protein
MTGIFEEMPRELQQDRRIANDQMVHRRYPEHGNDPVTELDHSLESARSRGYGRYEI